MTDSSSEPCKTCVCRSRKRLIFFWDFSATANPNHRRCPLASRKEHPLTNQFERNEYGHIVLTLEGLDLTGSEEIERLIAAGLHVRDWAKLCLLSTNWDGYDKNHQLAAGQYKIALMPTQEITDRTTDALYKRGIEKYGYVKPLAGIVPRLCESVSDKQMEEMGFGYIAAPHDTIMDFNGYPRTLFMYRRDDGHWLDAFWVISGINWPVDGAFAFFAPIS